VKVVREAVEDILQRIRPQLLVDGADIELLEVTDDGVVRLRLVGGCCKCPFSQMALHAGLESTLKDSVNGVTRVELVRGEVAAARTAAAATSRPS
jgi:Fe-S cluster biogenesis protein NfuA